MANRSKLPNTYFAKIGYAIGKVAEDATKFVGKHKEAILGSALALTVIDGIRLRLCRKRDQKAFEVSSIKQQLVARKQKAEIDALRVEAEQAHEIGRRVDQLEQIVKSITEEREESE